ncbi:MFS transporter [Streptomyces sp. MB09-02B]|uniref:MFS transporter n=1 Tax=Streptomyces sp. MB09-02B TaxID=3028667 RepID=UPI0029AB221C|nr:MFS transporter [Streptomyces sp. MB09-02B]MDX3641649.1 MFS transporter [Streptomyces sp. MB09-02B]
MEVPVFGRKSLDVVRLAWREGILPGAEHPLTGPPARASLSMIHTTPSEEQHVRDHGGHMSAAAPGLFSPVYRARTLAVAATFVVTAFAALALNTVMPIAVQELGGLGLYAFVFGGFLTTSIVGTVLAGGIADRRGPAAPLYAGLACFAGGALLSGASSAMWSFLLGRYLQGLGGGAVTVSLYVVMGHGYPAALRPRMFSLATACWIVPSMMGPPIAGAVTVWLSWHWVFYGIGLLDVVVSVLLIKPLIQLRHAGAADEDAPEEQPAGETPFGEGAGLRILPAVAVAIGAGLLQYAGAKGAPYQPVAAVAGLLLLVGCLRHLVPAGTLRARRGIPSLVVLRGVAAAAYFTIETYIPLMLINERHWSAGAAGMALTGAALTWFAGSWLQGRPWLPWPRERVVLIGALIQGVGVAITLTGALRGALAVTVAVGLAVAGFGMGLLLPGVGILTLEYSPVSHQGRNSASLQLSDSLSSVLLVTLAGTLFNTAHVRAGADNAAFATVFGAALVAAAGAGLLARRITPPHPKGSESASPAHGC